MLMAFEWFELYRGLIESHHSEVDRNPAVEYDAFDGLVSPRDKEMHYD